MRRKRPAVSRIATPDVATSRTALSWASARREASRDARPMIDHRAVQVFLLAQGERADRAHVTGGERAEQADHLLRQTPHGAQFGQVEQGLAEDVRRALETGLADAVHADQPFRYVEGGFRVERLTPQGVAELVHHGQQFRLDVPVRQRDVRRRAQQVGPLPGKQQPIALRLAGPQLRDRIWHHCHGRRSTPVLRLPMSSVTFHERSPSCHHCSPGRSGTAVAEAYRLLPIWNRAER